MFSTNFSKIWCNFAQNKFFEKSKMALAKMQRTCCETTVFKALFVLCLLFNSSRSQKKRTN